MAWLVRNQNGALLISSNKPERINTDDTIYSHWGFSAEMLMDDYADTTFAELISIADELLIGKHITWDDEPVELKDE